MKTLDEIACGYLTDRSSKGWHDYFVTYDKFFTPLRHSPVKLLEIGVLGGGGILTWAEYFDHPQARIVGIDIELHRCVPIKDPRVSLHRCSSADTKALAGLPGPFDIVIDDGSHYASDQFTAFNFMWPRLAPGGLYAIEDLHVFASPAHCNSSMNIMQFIEKILEEMQGRGDLAQAKRDPSNKWYELESVTIRRGLAIFKKYG